MRITYVASDTNEKKNIKAIKLNKTKIKQLDNNNKHKTKFIPMKIMR